MAHDSLSQVIGTALIDDGFRRILLRNPQEALASFDLPSDELKALTRIRAHTLEQFAEQLVDWFSEVDSTPRVS